MAADFIALDKFDNTNPYAGEAISAINQLREAFKSVERVREKGDHMHNGSDFAVFEQQYGVPTGQGQTVWEMFDGTLTALKGVNNTGQALALINRVG